MDRIVILQRLLAAYKALFALEAVQAPTTNVTMEPVQSTTNADKLATEANIASQGMTRGEAEIYTQAKNHLGQHLTLDETVPHELGCMEAVSRILDFSGYKVPKKGIPGTIAGDEFFKSHPEWFERIKEPEQGAIINFVTGTGNGKIKNGHILVCAAWGAMYPKDWGLMSNDSPTGLFLERWTWTRAKAYYQDIGGMIPLIWRAI